MPGFTDEPRRPPLRRPYRLERPTATEVADALIDITLASGSVLPSAFHVMIEDGNVHFRNALFALDCAMAVGDPIQIRLAYQLVQMTPTQRRKVSRTWYLNLVRRTLFSR